MKNKVPFLIVFSIIALIGFTQAVTAPSNVLAYVPLNISNVQGVGTPQAFDAQVLFNASNYTSYENLNLSNVIFFNDSGVIIPSWLENGTSASTNAMWWVENATGLNANSNWTVYVGFTPLLSSNFNASNLTGENPLLSTTYGQFDNGRLVFPALYDNFSAAALNASMWNAPGGAIILSNGLIVPPNRQIFSFKNFTPGNITDWWGDLGINGGSNTQTLGGFQNGNGISGNTGAALTLVSSGGTNPDISSAGVQTVTNYGEINSTYSVAYNFTGNAYSKTNYTNQYNQTLGTTQTENVSFQAQSGATAGPRVSWVRVREQPPNDVMPQVFVGTLVPVVPNPFFIGNYNTTYYGQAVLNVSYGFNSSMYAFANCTLFLNSTYETSGVIANGTIASFNVTMVPQSNLLNNTCVNGSAVGFTEQQPYLFNGVNITVINGFNFTYLSGWNVTSSNGTFINWTNAQNSGYTWEWTNTGVNNSGYVWLNASLSGYGFANQTFNVSNATFLNVNLSLAPMLTFSVENATTPFTPVNVFNLIFTNGTFTATCTVTTGTCSLTLSQIPLGNDTVTVISNGFATTNFSKSYNLSSSGNTLFLIASAIFTTQVYDEQSQAPLWFNLTIANSTNSTTVGPLLTVIYNASTIPIGADTFTFTYANASNTYQPRTYFATFNNNTFLNLTAYLLLNSVSSHVGFNVVNSQRTNLVGALVTVGFPLNGGYVTVAQTLTGADGTAFFYLNPAVQYQINASYQGSVSNNNLITPGNPLYTIVINTGLGITNYTIFSNTTTFLLLPTGQLDGTSNATTISLLTNNTLNQLVVWSLNLTWNGTSIFFQNSTAAGGGVINAIINTSNYTSVPNITAVVIIQAQGYPPYTYVYVYYINTFNSPYGVFSVLINLTQQGLNPVTLELFAIIITLFASAWIAKGSSSLAGGLTAFVLLGFFTAIGWVAIQLFIIGLLVTLTVAGLAKGFIR
jgi:hypothetical protein